ncbi:hypothetical protein TrST_g8584 [Triparma strigata]|uniref:Peroxisomal trans-2-enoyl-CoA reductase n=1 Tax=Triparma strigata TaxID=1606541 RepID=A0A9W6ZF97_9STRA|nr:hypothetical protein TrST_g8584 [Triparma strigata]
MNTKPKTVFRPKLFDKKVALVTGGGTGIGFAIATELSLAGATVWISGRSEEKLDDAEKRHFKETGLRLLTQPCDIRNATDVDALTSEVLTKSGSIDILINNAGGQFPCSAEELSNKGFMAVVNLNLLGTFSMCREVFNKYMSTHGGSIANITLGMNNGMPLMAHSGAARAGVENMTKTLSQEWIASGVRINCVRPGIIYTESGFDNYKGLGDDVLNKIVRSIPAKRLGTAEEVASAAVFLSSDGARYITGQSLAVCGGQSFTHLAIFEQEDKVGLIPYGALPLKARL